MKSSKAGSKSGVNHTTPNLTQLDGEEALRAHVAEAAYYKAEARQFEPGHEMEDWLAAEAELAL